MDESLGWCRNERPALARLFTPDPHVNSQTLSPLKLTSAGPTEQIVRAAKNEIKRIVEEETERAMRRDAPSQGRYSVM